jgi:hypothetical protein
MLSFGGFITWHAASFKWMLREFFSRFVDCDATLSAACAAARWLDMLTY